MIFTGSPNWNPGSAPVAVIMISLNEGHNMKAACQNLSGWAQEVFLIDSYSQDDTIDIALAHGIHIIQRKFNGFGDQWNFALNNLPITAKWTMKLDPDERLTDELKQSIQELTQNNKMNAINVSRQLCFMGQLLPIQDSILRVWRTGMCSFTEVTVNEHPIVDGGIVQSQGSLHHNDSPDMEHWVEKQNRYTSSEALRMFYQNPLAREPKIFGTQIQRRMWLKKNFHNIPFRYIALFFYYWIFRGTCKAGWVGYIWARLRCDVMRLREYKYKEMMLTGRVPLERVYGAGEPDKRVPQCENNWADITSDE